MSKLAIHGGAPISDEYIPYGKQFIDEEDIQAVVDVLKGDYLTTGPNVDAFEKALVELTGAKYAVAISNGTAALHAACYAAGIGEGDEVITTPITFAASANSVLYCGATPVFADINPDTYNIDPASIEEKITEKTKAIIAVDFTGQAVEIEEIKVLCDKYDLVFIQDSAHSLNTEYKGKQIGSLADMTTLSFHPVKTITTGEGGAIITNDEEYYNKLVLFRSHGITRDEKLLSHTPYAGYNEQIELGYNYRMTDIQAALGVSQLNKVKEFTARRKEIVKRYDEAFSSVPEIKIQKEIEDSDTSRHLYVIQLNTEMLTSGRDEIYTALTEENIGLQVHYMPVYWHPYYQELGYEKGICPKAESLYNRIFTIPLYYSLSDEQVKLVIEGVKKVINYYRK